MPGRMVIRSGLGEGLNHACTSRNKATNFHVMHQEGEAAGGLGAAPLALLLSKIGKKRRERPESYCAPPGPETGRAGEGVQRAAVKIIFPLLIPQPCCGDKGEQSLQSPQIGARAKESCGNLFT